MCFNSFSLSAMCSIISFPCVLVGSLSSSSILITFSQRCSSPILSILIIL
nr:MAG TPA: hypothetical protein [Caudoviricetes sp.]